MKAGSFVFHPVNGATTTAPGANPVTVQIIGMGPVTGTQLDGTDPARR